MPEDLKEPDSLKGLPEGSALTADKEIKRAFITSIRPRLSQHEGRERVTKSSGEEPITEPLEPNGSLTDKEERTQEYSKEKEEILAVPSKLNLEEAEEIAESKINKVLGVLWSTENIRKTSKYYYPIWNALIDYHGEEESINLRAHLDGLTGELIRASNQGLKRTNGVRTLLDLTSPQIDLLLKILQNEPLSYEELEGSPTEKSNIKKVVKSLVEKEDLVRISKRKEKRLLRTKEKIDIPTKLSEKSLMRAEDMPEKETKLIFPEKKLDRVITEEKMLETLELFGDIEMIEIELFYYPYWVIELVSGEGSRILTIDGVLRKQDEYAENMLRRRVF